MVAAADSEVDPAVEDSPAVVEGNKARSLSNFGLALVVELWMILASSNPADA